MVETGKDGYALGPSSRMGDFVDQSVKVFRGASSLHHWSQTQASDGLTVCKVETLTGTEAGKKEGQIDPTLLGPASDPTELVARNAVFTALKRGTVSFQPEAPDLGEKGATGPKQ